MDNLSNPERAVELLQQLGLREYEAKSFVALTRLPRGTAKRISETADVPRTRVYDAVRVLETKGLVESQHANPQQFRAVPVDEAVDTLRSEYESRAETLRGTLREIEPVADDRTDVAHEVWALSGAEAIRTRTERLLGGAEREVVLVVGHASSFTEDLREQLGAVQQRGVTLVVGTITEELRAEVESELPDATAFVTGLDWLRGTTLAGDETEISRLLLVDRRSILVSTRHGHGSGPDEQAVFGSGFDNGLVTIVRRLMATGVLPAD